MARQLRPRPLRFARTTDLFRRERNPGVTGPVEWVSGVHHDECWKGYASVFYDMGGLDTGATVHYVGQYDDANNPYADATLPFGTNDFTNPNDITSPVPGIGVARKIREWTTLDLIVSYNVNSLDATIGGDVYKDVSIYRARFLDVKLAY